MRLNTFLPPSTIKKSPQFSGYSGQHILTPLETSNDSFTSSYYFREDSTSPTGLEKLKPFNPFAPLLELVTRSPDARDDSYLHHPRDFDQDDNLIDPAHPIHQQFPVDTNPFPFSNFEQGASSPPRIKTVSGKQSRPYKAAEKELCSYIIENKFSKKKIFDSRAMLDCFEKDKHYRFLPLSHTYRLFMLDQTDHWVLSDSGMKALKP